MRHRCQRRSDQQRRDSWVRCRARLLRRVLYVPDWFAGRAALWSQYKRNPNRNGNGHNRPQNRMGNRLPREQIRPRPDKRRHQIRIRNRPRKHHAQSKPPRPPRENSPSQSKRGKYVCGRIHGQDFNEETIVLLTFPRGTNNFSAFGTSENSTGSRASDSPSTCA